MKPRTIIITVSVILSISIAVFIGSCSILVDAISDRGVKNIVEEIWEGPGESK